MVKKTVKITLRYKLKQNNLILNYTLKNFNI